MVGALESARRHLNIAESLLCETDDVWLRGYLAINSSVLNYYSADVSEARRWAEAAIVCAQTQVTEPRAARLTQTSVTLNSPAANLPRQKNISKWLCSHASMDLLARLPFSII